MSRTLMIGLLTMLLLANNPLRAWAETVLEKIGRAGEMTVGAPRDAVPFSSLDTDKKWTGYSVELIKLIHQQVETQLNKTIKLNLVPVGVDNRFEKVQRGQVDLICGTTTITQERLEMVDFSIPFFMTGSQFLILKSEVNNFDVNETLKDVPIAYIPNTTSDFLIRQIYPLANWQAVKSREEAIEKLTQGKIKAIVSDGILLVGELVNTGKNLREFVLTPSQPITTELYGCMIPKNEPQLKELVNFTIISDDNVNLQKKWFDVNDGPYPYNVRIKP